MPLARTERRQRAGAHILRLTQGAKHARAGRFVTHDKRGGSALASRVEDKRGDRATVFRAREPVRETPILQRIAGGPFAGFDFFHNFNRRGDASARGHWELAVMALQSRASKNSEREEPPHQEQDDDAGNEELTAQRHIVRGRVDIGMRDARGDEQPLHGDKEKIGLLAMSTSTTRT